MKRSTEKKQEEITRKEALKKIGNYGKYSALTALGTYFILTPARAQVQTVIEQVTGGGGESSRGSTTF